MVSGQTGRAWESFEVWQDGRPSITKAHLDEVAGRTILVVDDEPVVARLLVEGLAAELPFVEVLAAHSGLEALDVMQRCPVDLVVTDVKMPMLDGMSLVARMVDRGLHRPVVMLTGFPADQIGLAARGHGVISVLDKPIDFPRLVGICVSTLRAWSRGAIEGVTLCGLLQLIAMERRSCRVRVFGRGDQGLVTIRDGDVITCSTRSLHGLEALSSIVAWEGPRIELLPWVESGSTVSGAALAEPISLQAALLESARRFDEARREAPEDAPRPAKIEPRDGRRLMLERAVALGMELEGVVGFAIVDEQTRACSYAQSNGDFPIERGAIASVEVVRAKRRALSTLGQTETIEDIVLTLPDHYHVIVPAPNGSTFLYLVLDRARANLALARYRLVRLEQSLGL